MRKKKKEKLSKRQVTAQEFTNVSDIQNGILYTKDGFMMKYIRILPVSVGLLSNREKKTLIRQLTSQLSVEKKPFHFLAIGRPVDMQPLLEQYERLRMQTSDPCRKRLFREEMQTVSEFTFGNEVVERQFYFYISEQNKEDKKEDLIKHANEFSECFESAGIKTEILDDPEIIRLCNLVNNPAVVTIEDEDCRPTIPILKEAVR